MKLLGFGPGEALDRLSILTLKILHANGQPTAHFVEEQTALAERLTTWQASRATWIQPALELGVVNAEIWRLNQELRQCQRAYARVDDPAVAAAGMAALRQQILNDRRAELVAAINQAAGVETGPEKL